MPRQRASFSRQMANPEVKVAQVESGIEWFEGWTVSRIEIYERFDGTLATSLQRKPRAVYFGEGRSRRVWGFERVREGDWKGCVQRWDPAAINSTLDSRRDTESRRMYARQLFHAIEAIQRNLLPSRFLGAV